MNLIIFSLILIGFFLFNFVVPTWSDYGLTDAINVTLNSPLNNSYSNLLNTNFTYIPEWNTSVTTMQNCTLYGNFTGSWAANTTNQGALENGIVNGINNTVSEGVYIWNVYCYDTTGQYDLGLNNWTVTVDVTKPQWSNNNTNIVTTYSPTTPSYFNITWTDGNGISKVLIEGNWSGQQNYSMFNLVGNVYSFNATLPAGSFYWKSYANDSANNWNASDTWYFTVSDVVSPQWSNQIQNTSTPLVGAAVNLSVYWTDDYNLSYAVLATNETSSWENKTTQYNLSLSGTAQWTNFTWQNSSVTKGTVVGWRVYANDSSNNWNVTDIMTFTLKVSDGSSCTANIECLGGYCVHGYCRSSSWYAGDGYCDSDKGESCSNSPSDCGVCPSPPSGIPSPGIPSPTLTTTPGKVVVYIPSIAAAAKANVTIKKTEGIDFMEINITVKNSIRSVYLIITKLDSKPPETPALVNVYRYINVVPQNVRDEDILKAKIKFKVEKSWINTNNIDPDTIALYRFSENKWNKLTTAKLSEDVDYIYYEAETPGFSYFAISGEVKVAPVAVCGNNICEAGENYTNCPQDCPAPCVEDWVCTAWSECIEGWQTRSCTDRNNCGTIEKKPIERQRCVALPSGIAIPLGLIVGIVVIIGVLVWKRFKPRSSLE